MRYEIGPRSAGVSLHLVGNISSVVVAVVVGVSLIRIFRAAKLPRSLIHLIRRLVLLSYSIRSLNSVSDYYFSSFFIFLV